MSWPSRRCQPQKKALNADCSLKELALSFVLRYVFCYVSLYISIVIVFQNSGELVKPRRRAAS